MTGLSALPVAEEGGEDYEDSTRWSGVPRILGPKWAQLPILTVGLLGVQLFWSVEMSYGASCGASLCCELPLTQVLGQHHHTFCPSA